MPRYILCPHCGNVWQISKTTNVRYGQYKCPDCCEKEKALMSGNSIKAQRKIS